MLSLFRRLYQPLNTITINEDSLLHNYRYLSRLNKNISVAPVLKSNAYGHDLVTVAKILEPLKPPFICVDSLYEGYELLKTKNKLPVLVMGFIHPHSLETKKLPFSFAVSSKEAALAVNQYQPQAPVHLFVDTGMHREGIALEKLPSFIRYLTTHTKLRINGLMSHFAMADQPTNKLTQQQLVDFPKAVNVAHQEQIELQWTHIAASSGLLHHNDYGDQLGNLARAGIALYGIDPENRHAELKPVLEFSSTIAQIKSLKRGEKVGYDFTFTAAKDMTIAILPVGYNDGVDRRLSNKGFIYVGNTACSIIGRVSMNITTIDISHVKNVSVGDKAVIYSSNKLQKNSISYAAAICQTIPYELLIHLHPSTRRVVLQNGG